MGAIKDRLRAQISLYENELTRIDTEALRSKQRIEADLVVLKQADAALTDDLEALVVKLGTLGIKFTA